MANLTRHAQNQCIARGIPIRKVVGEVSRYDGQIAASGANEVRIIVQRFSGVVYSPDGSNGDRVVACIDPANLNIKTVMLRRSDQIARDTEKIYLNQ